MASETTVTNRGKRCVSSSRPIITWVILKCDAEDTLEITSPDRILLQDSSPHTFGLIIIKTSVRCGSPQGRVGRWHCTGAHGPRGLLNGAKLHLQLFKMHLQHSKMHLRHFQMHLQHLKLHLQHFEFLRNFEVCQTNKIKCLRARDLTATPNVPANLKDPTLDGYGKTHTHTTTTIPNDIYTFRLISTNSHPLLPRGSAALREGLLEETIRTPATWTPAFSPSPCPAGTGECSAGPRLRRS